MSIEEKTGLGGNQMFNGTRAVVGVMEVIIAILLLLLIARLDTVAKRADTIIEYHNSDMELLISTAQVRNRSVRVISEKLGVPRDQIEAILAEDLLANQVLPRRHGFRP